jgi:alpha-galactosidase
VQGTSEMLAHWVSVPYEEVNFLCAGINHQAFFLEFRQSKEDLYPRLWEVIQREDIYGQEPVRIDLMKYFGYFVTESSGHASEYVPYFRKSASMVNEDLAPRFKNPGDKWFDFGRTGGYLRECISRLTETQVEYKALIEGTKDITNRTHEYGSYIIEAMETNRPARINGNVPNYGLIDNLPDGCCVEVPCLVDANGIQPTTIGTLPAQLAALNRACINVQELVIEACLTGDTDAVYHAVMVDPLTAAVCTLPQIKSMVKEMLAAQAHWLPQLSLK